MQAGARLRVQACCSAAFRTFSRVVRPPAAQQAPAFGTGSGPVNGARRNEHERAGPDAFCRVGAGIEGVHPLKDAEGFCDLFTHGVFRTPTEDLKAEVGGQVTAGLESRIEWRSYLGGMDASPRSSSGQGRSSGNCGRSRSGLRQAPSAGRLSCRCLSGGPGSAPRGGRSCGRCGSRRPWRRGSGCRPRCGP